MIKTQTTISNKLGLHARASAKFTKLAGSFASEVWMSKGERRVNAKSIMGVMMLAAGIGSSVEIETHASSDGVQYETLAVLSAMLDAALNGFPQPPPGPRRINAQIPR